MPNDQHGSSVYLETSAFNALLANPGWPVFASLLGGNSQLLITATLQDEIYATTNPSKRRALGELAQRLGGSIHPVAPTGAILRRSVVAFLRGDVQLSIGVAGEDISYQSVLANPELADDDLAAHLGWDARRRRSDADTTAAELRSSLAEDLKRMDRALVRTASTTARWRFEDASWLESLLSSLLAQMDSAYAEALAGRAQDLLRQVEAWRFLAGASAFDLFQRFLYNRAGRTRTKGWTVPGGGRSALPNEVDRDHVVYLACCSTFVTSDWSLYKMVRWVSRLAHQPRRVVFVRAA